MAKDTLSILGLYRANPTLFDLMVLPEPLESDKETLINNLLMECAEFEVLYTDVEFMKWAIGQWSNKNLEVWEKEYNTTQFEYDPIANYDRHENWTDTGHNKTKSTPKTTVTYQEGGYNTGSGLYTTNKTESGGTDEVESWNDVGRTGRAYGNIGVTTTQQMIEQERESVKYNMFNVIIHDFQERFCLMIY